MYLLLLLYVVLNVLNYRVDMHIDKLSKFWKFIIKLQVLIVYFIVSFEGIYINHTSNLQSVKDALIS